MKDRKDLTVPVPGKMADAIEAELDWGDSRSAWIREAIRQRLESDGVAFDDEDAEEREEASP